jgi:hypothetical protein
MGLTLFTIVHVIISLVAIATGFIVVGGWIGRSNPRAWTSWFLWTTVATSVTGFFFPFKGFTPAYAFGVLSLLLLGAAFYALRSRALAGKWRGVYVITALIALYLNTFVLVVQSFQKVPALKALAPTQGEPPFAIAQGTLLVLCIIAGFFSLRRFPRTTPVAI